MRRARPTALLTVALTAAAGVSACGGSEGGSQSAVPRAFPSSITSAYVRGCVASVQAASPDASSVKATQRCGVALTCIEKALTLERFIRVQSATGPATESADARTVARCGTDAAAEVRVD